jgi:hypothetical protein
MPNPFASAASLFGYTRQMNRAKDRVGQKYGRLTVIERAEKNKNGALWLCSCECGSRVKVLGSNLGSGNTTSCGCIVKAGRRKSGEKIRRVVTHGLTGHPLFVLWGSMRARCTNPNHHAYARYGGRGISCSPRWDDFALFLADVGERPEDPGHWQSERPYWTLDRIDPDGNYEPGNVRWGTPSQQRLNRSELV